MILSNPTLSCCVFDCCWNRGELGVKDVNFIKLFPPSIFALLSGLTRRKGHLLGLVISTLGDIYDKFLWLD